MKRYVRLAILTACAFALTALAGCDTGFHNSGDDTPPGLTGVRSVTQDTVSGCKIEGVHEHAGVYYAGHYNNDGHAHNGECSANDACAQINCAKTGLHQHDGTHYAGHSGEDGCGHHGQGQHGGGHE